jgi:catechol 2,3-dioxygenase-like lactoylglutathione lyase family enzyme
MPLTRPDRTLVAKNLRAHEKFYQDVLGMELADRPSANRLLAQARRGHLRAPRLAEPNKIEILSY